MAFNSAVERINSHGLAEPGERYTPTSDRLLTRVEHIERADSFQASRKVCTLLEEGVAAVFGPQSTDASFAVRSACETLDVPHIETHWDYRSRTTNHSLNLYPHPSALGKAYLDFIKYKDWKNFAILYEENDALVRLQEILKDATLMKENRVTVRQFEIGTEYRKTLKDIGKTGIKNIVLDVPIRSLYTVLKHAQQVDMMSEYHNYFITSLDAHTIDTEDFQYGGTNISAFRLIDFSSKEIDEVARDWIQRRHRFSSKKSSSVQSNFNTGAQDFYKNLTTKVALMYDAVRLFATALKDLHPDSGPKIQVAPLSCEREHKWSQGNAFVKYMRMINIKGLTGNIRFNKDGHRTDMRLTVLDMAHSGWREAGEWTMHGGINITTNYTRELEEARLSLLNKTLVVTTILQPPYVMYKENWRDNGLTGNDKYEGYCIDLLDAIASSEHFDNNMKYVIREVADNSYGRKDADGRWNGMIGELLSGKADLAVADLTITFVREEAVDFTMPFMTLGISILYKKTAKPPPGLFSFLDPLSLEVWIYMMTAFLGVSLFLFVLARFSPYEWVNPHPCEGNPEELDNQFTIWNTLWFTIGCLMQQGCDVTPRALSTRVAAGMWWFFTLIMVSSYTANLAAFLTVERLVSPIESVEDLAKQTTIQYGCLRSGSTQSFFKDSQFPTYAKMWHVMQSQRPTVFAESNQKGIDRVLRGKYAYLMESTSIEYNIERNCDLTQIGSLLDNKGYGIATPPGSPYRTMLSQAILRLQENGDLHVLKERWWKKKRISKKCPKDIINKGTSAMTVASVGGVFIVLLVGSCVAIISAIVEFVWRAKKIVPEERDPVCVELCRELKFTLTCGSKKPLTRPRSDENLAIAATDNGMGPFMGPITGFGLHNKNTFS
ncbi:glutamate receptor ionotropic, kainate 2-like [Varroa jacobsoni]|nr:glutamate receptor ionotropic, kainate 2-like [Varroa jacobsoni]XP_022701521.1 glutamate receptor ionotropic, kainate 2-like [Varroa jacobsoni]